jgi:hypothetical protein
MKEIQVMNSISFEQLVAAHQLDSQREIARRERYAGMAMNDGSGSSRRQLWVAISDFVRYILGRMNKLGREYEGQAS